MSDLKLRIGDVSDNGQVTIVDEDRLCYQVKSESKGAVGIRTISKALLKEFVQYFEQHPDTNANQARDALSGASDIDKFEYGYASTLTVLAKMALHYSKVRKTTLLSPVSKLDKYPLQQIFYGAPGTGKSFAIKELTKGQEVIRTTFHPDSDYSTFVGCYKPSMSNSVSTQRLYLSLEDLAKILLEYYNDNELGKIGGLQKFCYDYYPFIDGDNMSVSVAKLLELAGISDNYKVEIDKYVKFCRLLPKVDNNKIVYKFIPQAFTNAYVRAWSTKDPVLLVIEEINRGNCAQIFGDLFQLLDRKNGESEYPVKADADLAKHLAEELAKSQRDDIPADVRLGDMLKLPSNLYIWASMNTSDQSLFPIDSAFKRRWEWKYVPIANAEKNWAIEANGKKYDWWDFLKKINALIGDMTNSEDKKLGYFFCKTQTGIIDAETFVGKVIFYLWNDVFKDFEFEGDVFVDSDGETKLTFDKFYKPDATVQESSVEVFLNNLGVEMTSEEPEEDEDDNMLDELPEEPSEAGQNPSTNLGRQRFYVTFPDGTTIEERTQFETYTKALQKIGLEKAEPVAAQKRYTRKNCALIDRIQRDEILNSSGFSYVTIEGYHIVKNILVDTMRDVINNISQVLGLGVQAIITRV
jgi:hypothetical protein